MAHVGQAPAAKIPLKRPCPFVYFRCSTEWVTCLVTLLKSLRTGHTMQALYLNSKRWKLATAALCLGLAPALSAQNLTVRSVAVLGSSSQPQVEVKTSGPVSPATQAVTGPDRIVIDFPGALPASTLKKLAVHRGGLQRIRTGLFQSQPPITRIV